MNAYLEAFTAGEPVAAALAPLAERHEALQALASLQRWQLDDHGPGGEGAIVHTEDVELRTRLVQACGDLCEAIDQAREVVREEEEAFVQALVAGKLGMHRGAVVRSVQPSGKASQFVYERAAVLLQRNVQGLRRPPRLAVYGRKLGRHGHGDGPAEQCLAFASFDEARRRLGQPTRPPRAPLALERAELLEEVRSALAAGHPLLRGPGSHREAARELLDLAEDWASGPAALYPALRGVAVRLALSLDRHQRLALHWHPAEASTGFVQSGPGTVIDGWLVPQRLLSLAVEPLCRSWAGACAARPGRRDLQCARMHDILAKLAVTLVGDFIAQFATELQVTAVDARLQLTGAEAPGHARLGLRA